MTKARLCRPRHRYAGKDHLDTGCAIESWPHWHVMCRRCRFEWMQPVLFRLEPMT